jgi:ribosomal protein S18 acetylase RimI-like enzyme
MEKYQIINTTKDDFEFTRFLFKEAISYQQRKNYPVWNGFDKEVIIKDIERQQQYKIISGHAILCIFSIVTSDPFIWRNKDKGDAIYLHRIVVNPLYKGNRQFAKIIQWAIDYAKQQKLKYIRMDTWAHNPNIIAYYKSFGFQFLENYKTSDSIEFALHQRNLELALLEYEIS